jgi:demethylmenaquinone methyltransferase/2-methoxy-6-polyprenyl-1,4-benzoquinol methylase
VSDDARIREQIEFYRQEARQLAKLGLTDMAPDELASAALGTLTGVVESYCPPSSRCLELASGWGRFTRPLLHVCEQLTAVDASGEMHAINRAFNGDARVEYVEADLFEYVPRARYDLVFAGFWLSHVPETRFAPFWDMVATALALGGCVVMVDDGIRHRDGVQWFAEDPTGSDAHRRLWDGQQFTIVKNAYDPSELERHLSDLGWSAEVTPLTREVYVVVARKRWSARRR